MSNALVYTPFSRAFLEKLFVHIRPFEASFPLGISGNCFSLNNVYVEGSSISLLKDQTSLAGEPPGSSRKKTSKNDRFYMPFWAQRRHEAPRSQTYLFGKYYRKLKMSKNDRFHKLFGASQGYRKSETLKDDRFHKLFETSQIKNVRKHQVL